MLLDDVQVLPLALSGLIGRVLVVMSVPIGTVLLAPLDVSELWTPVYLSVVGGSRSPSPCERPPPCPWNVQNVLRRRGRVSRCSRWRVGRRTGIRSRRGASVRCGRGASVRVHDDTGVTSRSRCWWCGGACRGARRIRCWGRGDVSSRGSGSRRGRNGSTQPRNLLLDGLRRGLACRRVTGSDLALQGGHLVLQTGEFGEDCIDGTREVALGTLQFGHCFLQTEKAEEQATDLAVTEVGGVLVS